MITETCTAKQREPNGAGILHEAGGSGPPGTSSYEHTVPFHNVLVQKSMLLLTASLGFHSFPGLDQ